MTKLIVPGVGDNSGFAAGQLVSIVERIESLEEEKKALTADIAEVYSEAKGNGFDSKILRKCIALRKMAEADRDEQAAIMDLYMAALHRATKRTVAESLAAADDADAEE